MSSWLLLMLAITDGGATSPEAYDAGVPSTWRLSAKLGAGPAREALIKDLGAGLRADGGIAPGVGVGETPLTRAEVEALLADPRAELVYGDKTVSIVAPSMVKRHRQEHVDLMARFLQPERVQAGLQFRKDKEAVLSAVEKKTGVDREVIIGILMWESKLGTITGDFLAFNALASQAYFVEEANAVALAREPLVPAPVAKKGKKVSEEELAKWQAAKEQAEKVQRGRMEKIRERGRRNLVVLIRQCKTRGIDPLSVKGSWAGALGFPQFMPASLRWADDGNGDGKIDLFEMDDAIASVGRYLQEAGFKRSRRDAVYNYNHEQVYVDGVLAFADALKAGGVPDAGASRP
jgi:membrane-bound lytic murein transglycosylase B